MEVYEEFNQLVWDYYHDHGRDLPWRQPEADGLFDPYKIMVSEIMLQQTQAVRVIPKYHEFLSLFPTVQSLAKAPLSDVLKAWNGLGYNRRAKFLWQAAQKITEEFPDTAEELIALPGIGTNTAGAILAYGFNKPVVFIETNIRSIYIHHFFADRIDVHDKEILLLVEATAPWNEGKEQPETLAHIHPREWYWALMDYGVYLKNTIGNTSRSSKHYAKQSTFAGSKRQIRGQVIKLLTEGPCHKEELQQHISDARLDDILVDLAKEQLIRRDGQLYRLY